MSRPLSARDRFDLYNPLCKKEVPPTDTQVANYTKWADILATSFIIEKYSKKEIPQRTYQPLNRTYKIWAASIREFLWDEPECINEKLRENCTTGLHLMNVHPYIRNRPDVALSFQHKSPRVRMHLWLHITINVAKGYTRPSTNIIRFSRYFGVPKPPFSSRMIFHASSLGAPIDAPVDITLNDTLEFIAATLDMPGDPTAIRIHRQVPYGGYIKRDDGDAFRTLHLDDASSRACGYLLDGVSFRDLNRPFGISVMPKEWCFQQAAFLKIIIKYVLCPLHMDTWLTPRVTAMDQKLLLCL